MNPRKPKKPNTAHLASYHMALRQYDERARALRVLALTRDWHRQRDMNKMLRVYVNRSLWLFAIMALASAAGIIARVL